MKRWFFAGAVVGYAVTAASAQQVRIVERTGQAVVTSSDAVLDLAIQVRVQNGFYLNNANFNMRIVGEAEGRGVLARSLISELDGTYATAIATNSTVGRGGLARQFTYLAGISGSFNGLINTSGGSFTNGPDQEIGLIAAQTGGSALLGTPGLDVDGDGNPDTWSGNGTGQTPAIGTIVPMNPALAGPYFAGGQFIDIYRFRYSVTNLTARSLNFTLVNPDMTTFVTLVSTIGGVWGPSNQSGFGLITVTPLTVQVVPAPTAIMMVGLSMGICTRRRCRC